MEILKHVRTQELQNSILLHENQGPNQNKELRIEEVRLQRLAEDIKYRPKVEQLCEL